MLVGFGLKEDNAGAPALDMSVRAVWLDQHTFLRPIVLSPEQKILTSQLYTPNVQNGDLLVYNDGWSKLPKGGAGQVLCSHHSHIQWGELDLDKAAKGVLPINLGGTGTDMLPASGLALYTPSGFGSVPDGDGFLFRAGESYEWRKLGGLEGSGAVNRFALWNGDGSLGDSALKISGDHLEWQGGITLLGDSPAGIATKGKSAMIGVNFASLSRHSDGQEGGFLKFDFSAAAEAAVCSLALVTDKGAVKTLAGWNRNGVLLSGQVPTQRLVGTMTPKQGGTGLTRYSAGDMLYADQNGALAKLSTTGKEGWFLRVVNGLPTWVEHDRATVITQSEVSPMRWESGTLSYQGKQLVLYGEDIAGNAAGLTTPLSPAMGGTGANLSVLGIGALMVSTGAERFSGIKPGKVGRFLCSEGEGQIPTWRSAITEITTPEGSGIDVDRNRLSLDTSASFNPVWRGDHTFAGSTGFALDVVLGNALHLEPVRRPRSPETGDLYREGGHLYYRTEGSTVCLSENKDTPEAPKETQYVCIAHGVTFRADGPCPVPVPIPYGASSPTERKRWRPRRVDIRCEVPPTESIAVADILVGGESLLQSPIEFADRTDSGFTILFARDAVFSGDLIRLSVSGVGDSEYWSAWILFESE